MKKILILLFVAMVATACWQSQPAPPPQIVIPSVSILSPQPGDKLEAGKPIQVKWKATGMPAGSIILLSVSNNDAGTREGESVDAKVYKADLIEGEGTYQIPMDDSPLSKALFHNLRLTGSTFQVNLLSLIPTPGQKDMAYFGPGTRSAPFAIVASAEK